VVTINDVWNTWLMVAYIGVVVFLISLSFVIVRLGKEIGIFQLVILVNMDFIIFAIGALIIQFMINISIYSKSYIHIAKKSARTRLDFRILNSFQPVRFSVGRIFTFESKDFCLHTFGSIVLETTINLLLTFKKSQSQIL